MRPVRLPLALIERPYLRTVCSLEARTAAASLVLIPFLNQKLYCRLRFAMLKHCLWLAFAFLLIWK
jgi:hypothetical protein